MLNQAFPKARRSYVSTDRLLQDFNYLISGRNLNVHPDIDAVVFDEMQFFIRVLEREDDSRRLSVGAFTSLKILKAERVIARCVSPPHRCSHHSRVRGDHR